MPAVARPEFVYEEIQSWEYCEHCGRTLDTTATYSNYGGRKIERVYKKCSQVSRSWWSRHFGVHTEALVRRTDLGTQYDPVTGEKRYSWEE